MTLISKAQSDYLSTPPPPAPHTDNEGRAPSQQLARSPKLPSSQHPQSPGPGVPNPPQSDTEQVLQASICLLLGSHRPAETQAPGLVAECQQQLSPPAVPRVQEGGRAFSPTSSSGQRPSLSPTSSSGQRPSLPHPHKHLGKPGLLLAPGYSAPEAQREQGARPRTHSGLIRSHGQLRCLLPSLELPARPPVFLSQCHSSGFP